MIRHEAHMHRDDQTQSTHAQRVTHNCKAPPPSQPFLSSHSPSPPLQTQKRGRRSTDETGRDGGKEGGREGRARAGNREERKRRKRRECVRGV
eukprot:1007469-Rhodomonas_salina.1